MRHETQPSPVADEQIQSELLCVSVPADIDVVCVWWGVVTGSWCIGGRVPRKLPVPFFRPTSLSSPHLTSSTHPPPTPPLSLSIYCPLSNLIIQALYSPHLFLSVCVSFALMSPSPAGCFCGQTSRSNLSLPLSFIYSLHWLYISCALSLFSNFCLCPSSQIYFCYFLLLFLLRVCKLWAKHSNYYYHVWPAICFKWDLKCFYKEKDSTNNEFWVNVKPEKKEPKIRDKIKDRLWIKVSSKTHFCQIDILSLLLMWWAEYFESRGLLGPNSFFCFFTVCTCI